MAPLSDLNSLRKKIDEIDAAIVDLLAQRMAVCKDVAAVKAQSATAVMQPQRVREVLSMRRQWAIDKQVDPDFTGRLILYIRKSKFYTYQSFISQGSFISKCTSERSFKQFGSRFKAHSSLNV